ncbi:hypothetical protein D3C71_1388220 [compost metagenome]
MPFCGASCRVATAVAGTVGLPPTNSIAGIVSKPLPRLTTSTPLIEPPVTLICTIAPVPFPVKRTLAEGS